MPEIKMLKSEEKPKKVKREVDSQDKEISSYSIFSSFVKVDENGECDATGVLDRECYVAWINSRKFIPKNPHEAFRRAVTAHIRGNDGRRPFTEEAERSLLKELRKKQQWKAFEGTNLLVGIKGFSSLGHHEKRRLFKMGKSEQLRKQPVKEEITMETKSEEMASRKRERSPKLLPATKPIKREKFDDITESTVNSTKIHLAEPETDQLLKFLKQEGNLVIGLTPENTLNDTYPKSCTHDFLFSSNLDNFDPWLDEMLDTCSDNLDGVEYPNVFENPRFLEIMY